MRHGALGSLIGLPCAAGALVLLGSCGQPFASGEPSTISPPGVNVSDADLPALEVTPGDSKLGVLRPLSFNATIPVTWSVQEGAAGGAIDAAGKYVSPATPGTYHVVATSTDDATVSRSVTVTVVGLGVTVMAGVIGGAGNIDGPASRAHFRSPQGIAEYYGWLLVSDSANHTIRKYDPKTDLVTTLAGTAGLSGTADGIGPTARFRTPASIVADTVLTGNAPSKGVWVADLENYCIRSLDPVSGRVGTLAGACGTSGHQDGTPPNASFGYIYGLTLGPRRDALYACDQGSGVRRIDVMTGQVTTIASPVKCLHMATDTYNLTVYESETDDSIGHFSDAVAGGPGPNTKIAYTSAVIPEHDQDGFAFAPGHGIFTPGGLHPVIYHYDPSKPAFDPAPLTGSPTERGTVDGPIDQARWYRATEIDAAPAGRSSLYAVDLDTIRSIDLVAMTVSTVTGAHDNVALVDGPVGTGRMTGPSAIASDPAGNVYVADVGFYETKTVAANVIRKIDASGALTKLSGAAWLAQPAQVPLDGSATDATFGIPASMVYVEGTLYVVDLYGQAIRAVKVSDGSVTTLAGELGTGGYQEGAGGSARFSFYSQLPSSGLPRGAGIASDGTNLYVADTANHAIRKIVIATGAVSTLAGGTQGTANGTGKAAQFLQPLGLAYDRGILYVADGQDNVLRSIDVATAGVSTLAGLSGVAGTADGDAKTATFASPSGLLADRIGSLYVVESYASATPSGLLRRVDLATGVVSTVAGTRGQSGVARGPAPSTLNCPSGIALTPAGDTLVSDLCDGVVVLLSAW
jgi:hypothetical protein